MSNQNERHPDIEDLPPATQIRKKLSITRLGIENVKNLVYYSYNKNW